MFLKIKNYQDTNIELEIPKLLLLTGENRETIFKILFVLQRFVNKLSKNTKGIERKKRKFPDKWEMQELAEYTKDSCIEYETESSKISIIEGEILYEVKQEQKEKEVFKACINRGEYFKRPRYNKKTEMLIHNCIYESFYSKFLEGNVSYINEFSIEKGADYPEPLSKLSKTEQGLLTLEILLNSKEKLKGSTLFIEQFGEETLSIQVYKKLISLLLALNKRTNIIMTINPEMLKLFTNSIERGVILSAFGEEKKLFKKINYILPSNILIL